MSGQPAIHVEALGKRYVVGRRRVKIMPYAPKEPHHMRYEAARGKTVPPEMAERVTKDALTLCEGLGYDLNTVEFAVRDGIPIAIDFMNCAPDADLASVGEENFNWIVRAMSEYLLERAKDPLAFEHAGTWSQLLGLSGGGPVMPLPSPNQLRPRSTKAGTKVAVKKAPARKKK